ncbi:hypothetical protein ACFL7M_16795 [Thermodesulfobacteriota bacterium]
MAWRTLNNKPNIMQIFKHLIIDRVEIVIRFKGKEADFTSKFIKINQDKILSEIGKEPELIIEKLTPELGNILIQSSPEFMVEFLTQQNLCRCNLEYIETSNTYPHFGYILNFPESIEIAEKRMEERVLYERPEFISVEFRLGKKSKENKLYKFNVFEYSNHGLGIIIPPKDFDLLQKIDVGDKLEDITFYATWTMIRVNGTVKHKTKINEGKYRDSYILGIESPEIIESCKPMKGSEAGMRETPLNNTNTEH